MVDFSPTKRCPVMVYTNSVKFALTAPPMDRAYSVVILNFSQQTSDNRKIITLNDKKYIKFIFLAP